MTTYRPGTHPGTIVLGEQLVVVVLEGDARLADRICQLLNGPPYPKRCTMDLGVRGCLCEPWPDCYKTSGGTPDVSYARGAREALGEVRRRVEALPVSRIVNRSEWDAVQVPDVLAAVDAAAAELGVETTRVSASPQRHAPEPPLVVPSPTPDTRSAPPGEPERKATDLTRFKIGVEDDHRLWMSCDHCIPLITTEIIAPATLAELIRIAAAAAADHDRGCPAERKADQP